MTTDRLERVGEDRLRVTIPPEKPIVYDIVFGYDLFPRIAADLATEKPASRYVIITDSELQRLGYVDALQREMKTRGLRVEPLVIPSGERHKTQDWASRLLEALGRGSYNRDTMILNLGGGVIGDLGGYVAGTYLRGIPFTDIPTTTLSQADSAIGGKKGVDLESGKNLAGVFAQARRVYMDFKTLETLDDANYRAGLVEGVKHGVIADRGHFEYFERHLDAILRKDSEALRRITGRNCDIKGTIIQQDPKEKGLRKILNFGHTLGHAVEKASGYGLLHGQAVAIGMNFAARLAHEVGDFPLEEVLRQKRVLTSLLEMPLIIPPDITNEQLFAIMAVDKKAEAGEIRFCYPKEFGVMEEFGGKYTTPVPREVVEEVMNQCRVIR
jgi:3-dehydroquinate synthase